MTVGRRLCALERDAQLEDEAVALLRRRLPTVSPADFRHLWRTSPAALTTDELQRSYQVLSELAQEERTA